MNNKELNFAYKVRHALNENLENLPPSTTQRLTSARQIALTRKKPSSSSLKVFAFSRLFASSTHGASPDPLAWLGRIGALAPILFVAAGLIGIYQLERQERISQTAEIDAMVLTDDLPLTAYLDDGFNAYLAERRE